MDREICDDEQGLLSCLLLDVPFLLDKLNSDQGANYVNLRCKWRAQLREVIPIGIGIYEYVRRR